MIAAGGKAFPGQLAAGAPHMLTTAQLATAGPQQQHQQKVLHQPPQGELYLDISLLYFQMPKGSSLVKDIGK